ncbi:hypothetical protein M5689_022424 [Euphorbia peplus]|nr:hypothetical protein M5689_022424 [Euphorbia peplus]
MEETAPKPSGTSHPNPENEIELSTEIAIDVPDNEQICSLAGTKLGPKVEGIRNSLEQKINKAPKLLNSRAAHESCSIFRVPKNVIELHPKYFQPGIVSIGPYYHGQEGLEMMEEQKCRIVRMFLGYLREGGVDFDELLKAIAEKEDEIRRCYSHNTDQFSPDELIEMMIIDGFFIIYLLCVVGRMIIPESDDPIFNFPWMLSSVTRDLLMIENQIPFIVLQTLYDESFEDVPPLQELILKLMNISLPRYSQVSKLCDKYKSFRGKHILDFYRSTYIPSSEINDQENSLSGRWCCQWSSKETRDNIVKEPCVGGGLIQLNKWVKKLRGQCKEKADTHESLLRFIQPVETLLQAGIKFKKREGTDSFLDIEFNHGALKIPRLVTGEIMSTLILNCIMFEQCYKHRSKHFISYFNFMGHLMNTTFDAGYLREKKIIENFFGTDEELVSFFNEVGKNVPYYFNEDYLVEVAENVEIYYRSVRHVGCAEFKYKYCGSLWICLSASAALLLVLLTILQTFFTVYPYYNPRD